MNIKKIIESSGLNKNEVAKQLFPTHAFPEKALDRIMNGHGFLYTNQVEKLAVLLNVEPDLLYGADWKASFNNNVHTFVKKNHVKSYTAALNIETWETVIFEDTNLKVTKIIGSPNMLLKDYFTILDRILITL